MVLIPRTPPWCDFHAPILHRYTQQALWGAVLCEESMTRSNNVTSPLIPKYKRVCKCVQAPCEQIHRHEAMMGRPLMSKCTPAWSSPLPNCRLDSYMGWTDTAWYHRAHLQAHIGLNTPRPQGLDLFHEKSNQWRVSITQIWNHYIA